MTPEQIKVVRELRSQGYAVCIFTPEEMTHSDPSSVEDSMCEAGWAVINFDTPANETISA